MSQCLLIEAAGHLGEAYKPVRAAIIRDTGRVSDTFFTVRRAKVSEHGTVAEALSFFHAADMSETLCVAETYTLAAHQRVLVSETLRAGDRYESAQRMAIAEELHVSEAWLSQQIAVPVEVLHVVEAYTPVRHPTASVSETARVSDKIKYARRGTFADMLHTGEAWTAISVARLADSGALTDRFTPVGSPRLTVSESARALGSFTPITLGVAVVRERAWLDEAYLPPALDNQADVWTANTDSFGMSRYTGWKLDSIAVHNGVLHGVDSAGLWRLNADDDAGTPIDGSITTGLDTLGSEQVKHPRMLYGWATVGVPAGLLATIRDTTNGATSPTYTYTFESRFGDDVAPQRCALGRGLKTRYIQFTVGNVAGADFMLDALAVAVDPASRRV